MLDLADIAVLCLCEDALSKCLFCEEVDLQFQKVKKNYYFANSLQRLNLREEGTLGFPHDVKNVEKVCSKTGRDRSNQWPSCSDSIEYTAVVS